MKTYYKILGVVLVLSYFASIEAWARNCDLVCPKDQTLEVEDKSESKDDKKDGFLETKKSCKRYVDGEIREFDKLTCRSRNGAGYATWLRSYKGNVRTEESYDDQGDPSIAGFVPELITRTGDEPTFSYREFPGRFRQLQCTLKLPVQHPTRVRIALEKEAILAEQKEKSDAINKLKAIIAKGEEQLKAAADEGTEKSIRSRMADARKQLSTKYSDGVYYNSVMGKERLKELLDMAAERTAEASRLRQPNIRFHRGKISQAIDILVEPGVSLLNESNRKIFSNVLPDISIPVSTESLGLTSKSSAEDICRAVSLEREKLKDPYARMGRTIGEGVAKRFEAMSGGHKESSVKLKQFNKPSGNEDHAVDKAPASKDQETVGAGSGH